MIETDMVYAFVKDSDWLKETAEIIFERIGSGEWGKVFASRETLHELFYVSISEGIILEDIISRVANLTQIDNLEFLPTTNEIDLLALTLMHQYQISSIFDAYQAATVLNQVEDNILISTDSVFDRIPGLERRDPRDLIQDLRRD